MTAPAPGPGSPSPRPPGARRSPRAYRAAGSARSARRRARTLPAARGPACWSAATPARSDPRRAAVTRCSSGDAFARAAASGASPPTTSSQPRTCKASISESCPDDAEAAADDDAHAAAEGLGVRQHVRAEEHRPALVAQPQDQLPDVAAPQRIEARHGLVEEHELGVVDERLRDAHALQHALRELAQLQTPFGADAHLVEQLGRAGRAGRDRSGRTGWRSSPAVLRRSGWS